MAIYDTLVTYIMRFDTLKRQIIRLLQSIEQKSHPILTPSAIEDAKMALDALLNFVPISKDDVFSVGGVRATSIVVL